LQKDVFKIVISDLYINVLNTVTFVNIVVNVDRLCGLVVRVSGYRYRGLGFDATRFSE
jgi:autonomous glycyl radical cofactor GrcA